MKEAIGGTWIYGIVLVFIVVFTTYVSVTTNYSRCFRIKDEILTSIEFYHGINDSSIQEIQSFLNGIGYRSEGKCPDDGDCWFGFSTSAATPSTYGQKTNFCVSKHSIVDGKEEEDSGSIITGPIGHPESAYYKVVVFFRLDWPIFRQFFNITISGETGTIYMPNDTIQQIKENKCR